jgi:peptide/nickel transport system substrate-binding protein
VAALVHCQLVYTDYSYGTGVYPDLADSWDVNEDASEYTFHLVHNATFHDGTPVTSADVAWTLNEHMEKEGAAIGFVEDIESIDTPDDFTVKVTLKEPDAAFLAGLGFFYGPKVLPKHLYEGTDWSMNDYNSNPVGCGPFKFVEWQKGSHITFEANEDYYRGRPHLDRFVMRFYAMESLINAFETGDIKYSYENIPISEVVRLQKDSKYRIEPNRIPLVYWMGFNLAVEPFDDARVRKAFALAIDREDISQRVFQGIYPPTWGQMPQGWAYNAAAETPYDPELAAQLLDEAGFTPDSDGVRMSVTFDTAAVMSFPDCIAVMQDHLKDIGIEVTVASTDWAGFVEKVIEQRDYAIGFGGGLAGPDPAQFEPFIVTDGYRNMMGYSNARVDELFAMARATTDKAQRQKYYYEAQEIMAEDLPRITFLDSVQAFPRWSEVKNTYFDKELIGRPSNMDYSFLYTYLDQ